MSSEVNASDQNKAAVIYMLVAVVLFSTLSVSFGIGGASKAPFLFVALAYLLVAINNIVYLFWLYPLKRNWKTLEVIWDNLWHPALFWTILAGFEYVFFAFSLKYLDVAVAAILIATWPIFLVVITARMFKKQGRYEKLTIEKWILLVVAFIGVGFVIASQNTAIDNAASELFTYYTIGGVVLVLLAAAAAGAGPPATVKWGAIVSQTIKEDNKGDDELFFAIVANIIGKIVSGVGFVILSVLFGERIGAIGIVGVLSASAYGLFGLGIASILLRVANIKTTNLSVNVLGYATPAVSLIWLAFASLINVPHVDWLIIGVAAIIAANLLLNFKVEIRAAYKALIIALWVCGTSVYLHTSFPLPDYVEIVGVIATLFILILAFRVDRLVRRTTEEESNEFFLFRRLTALVESGSINDDAPNQLREIGKHVKPSALRDAYGKLMQYFVEARKHHPEGDHDMLSELESRVDTLAHSKQQGANFGELTALGFMGFIMVSALLLFKPVELSGWEGLFVETSSFLLATAIVFLFANIFDLQHDRTNAILTKEKGKKYYSVAFDDAGDRGSERWISITVCIAITTAYIWLFLGKWIF